MVVPQAEAERVLERLEPIRAAERDLEAKARDGLEVLDLIRAILHSDRVESLD